MSQVTHPQLSIRSHATVALAAVLALAATVAVVLVLAIGGSSQGSSATPVAPSSQQPGIRYDGGPEEGVYAQPGPGIRYDGGPDEGGAARSTSGPR